jgi:RNA polymerase sigma factor (sigma-70 family)
VDICDADLVRLARDGDPVAFRLLVERYQPMARARAARLCTDPHEVDDIVQESFLRAFAALDRLRDPGRFAGWLGGIVLNVCRAAQRRAPLMLLADWPEQIHPVSADGPPSAEDLDRTDALRAAVADLPPGQRQAVEQFYYADQPVSQIGESSGAAKASLHKARQRLRRYLTTHRPDLIPAAARRTHMITVQIALAEPWPGERENGDFNFDQVVVVLSDDAGHRALPIWLTDYDGDSLWRLLDQPRGEAERAAMPEELPAEAITAQLLREAGLAVTGVDIDELGPDVTAARVELAGPGGTQHLIGRLGGGLALAAAAGAPVRVNGTVLDRLAVPVQGQDMLRSFLHREQVPEPIDPPRRRRFEPRNLSFADGLDRWVLGGTFQRAAQGGGHGQRDAVGSHWQDYSATAEDGSAILRSAVPEPYGLASLQQAIFADDYRGGTAAFRGELRTQDVAGQAALQLRVVTEGSPLPRAAREELGDLGEHDDYIATIAGTHDWTRHEVRAEIPANATIIRFGITLAGRGQIELRNPELIPRQAPTEGRALPELG